MSHPVKTTSFKSASGTKSLISGELLSVRLPSRIVPICVSEPIGLASPRRTASTPAIIVVATAPSPTTITPSLPFAGATFAAALFWPPFFFVAIPSPNLPLQMISNQFTFVSSWIPSPRQLRLLANHYLAEWLTRSFHAAFACRRRLTCVHTNQTARHHQRNLHRKMKAMKRTAQTADRCATSRPASCPHRPDKSTRATSRRTCKCETAPAASCAIPAGNATNVCTTGIMRPSSIAIDPYFLKEPRHAVQIVLAHQHPVAVALHQRPSALRANPIRDRRAKIAAHRARRRHQKQIEAPQVNQVAGKRHDDFRRKRNARRIQSPSARRCRHSRRHR